MLIFLSLNPMCTHLLLWYRARTVNVKYLCGRDSTPGIQFQSMGGEPRDPSPGWVEEVQCLFHLGGCAHGWHNCQMEEGCPFTQGSVETRDKPCIKLRLQSLFSTASSPGNYLETRILRPHPWSANSGNLEMESRNLCSNKPSRWF